MKPLLCCLALSVQYPVDTGSSPELCPAWAPLRRSPSALCFVCTCPSPSQSRAARWAAAERRDLCCLSLWAAQIHHHPIHLLQQRPSPSHRPPQQPFPRLNPVCTHALQLLTHPQYELKADTGFVIRVSAFNQVYVDSYFWKNQARWT